MFDFDNTPITHPIKLKAQYSCEPAPLLSYYGDWARVTLTDKTVLEVQSESELNSLLTNTGTASVNGQSVAVGSIKKIEFGTKVTAIPNTSLPLSNWTSLKTINGFHEGLKTIGSVFAHRATAPTEPLLENNTIAIPSTVTRVGEFFLFNSNDPNMTIVVNSTAAAFDISNNTLSSGDSTAAMYTKGIKIMGVNAASFISRFPNRNDTPYRNLYNGNNLTDFFAALAQGTAQDTFPVGALLPDLYNNSTSFNWVIVHYGSATLGDGSTGYGAYLWALVNMGAGTSTSADYGAGSLSTKVEQLFANISDSVKEKTALIKVPYVYSGTQKTVDAHMWLPSVVEVNGVAQASYGAGGYVFDYFSSNGTVTPTNSALAVRTAPGKHFSLRSAYNSTDVDYVKLDNGAVLYTTYNNGFLSSVRVFPCVFTPGLIRVRVSFNANGGTPEPPEQRVLIGRYAAKPEPDPTKEGEEFVGWFLQGETYDFVGEIPVMFRMNGGTPQTPVQYVKAGEYAEQPTEAPTREGYEFVGWYEAGTVPDDWDGVSVI